MPGYVYFTEEQKQRANAVDLEDFLVRQGEKLLRSGREKRLAGDHSITIRGNRWYDHATEKGGFAIRVKPPTRLSENACSIFGIRHADNKIRQAVSCL